jgi:putative ABC transport system permease protein
MKEQDRLWILMARKLSGEATPAEISELAGLQQKHPEMTYSLQMLTDLWKARNEEQDADAAFQRHLTRMTLHEVQQSATRPLLPAPAGIEEPARQSRLHASMDLLTNYFRTSWRSLSRNKGFSVINISGLAIGLASAIVLLLWIRNELSFDQFHKNRDRVYQILDRSLFDAHADVDGATPMMLGPVLDSGYHREIETVVRMNWSGAFIFSVGDKHVQTQGCLSDPGFFRLFSFPLLEGDTAIALAGPRDIILTEKLAKKLFGNEDPIGRKVRVDSTANFVVSAVMKDLPPNTRFTFEYLLPFSYNREVHWEEHNWKISTAVTYVLLRPGITEGTANQRIRGIMQANVPDRRSELFLHPMRKWELYSNFEEGTAAAGGIHFVRMLAFIAGFILLIACINYMNLSTARSIRRAREVGVRKVLGEGRTSLVNRFLSESLLIALLAGILALGIAVLILPWFKKLVNIDLSIPYGDPWFWIGGCTFILFTGLLAGSYPAFFLSAFRPANILRGHFKAIYAPDLHQGPLRHALSSFVTFTTSVTPRRLLVVLQFTFAITFIICTIVMYREFSYVWNRDTGYNRANLGFVYIKGDMRRNYAAIRDELLATGTITDITRTNSPISEIWTWDNNYHWEGEGSRQPVSFAVFRTDRHFVSTMGLKLLAGRDIDVVKYPADSTAMLLTKTAVRQMRLTDPIGRIVRNSGSGISWHVIGVIDDFVTGSLFNDIVPIAVEGPQSWLATISFRLNRGNSTAHNLAKLQAILKKYNPNYPFEYFSGDKYDTLRIRNQEHFGALAALFAGMAIFISCLGLFGLSAYMAESRLREIGVRKVLGASIMRLTTLLSKDFLALVLIAFVMASPIAWWLMKKWLEDYPYHTGLSWWVFAFTGVLCFFIAAGTVSFQAFRAALANPMRVLRTD